MEETKNGLPVVSIVLGIIGLFLNASSDDAMRGLAILLTIIAVVCAVISIFSRDYKKVCAIIGLFLCFMSFLMFNYQTEREANIEANREAYLEEYNSRSYVITFDTNGGQEITPMTVHPNTYLNKIVPYKEGYEFKNWTLDGAIFDFSGYVNDRITSDVTLKANYMKVEVRGAEPDGSPKTNNNSNNSNNKPSNNNSSNNQSSNNNNNSNSNNSSKKYGYEEIYNEYSKKLINAGPTSSISEMADICLEGGSKMADYMWKAKGVDGQYETYEKWWMKLYDVYLENIR